MHKIWNFGNITHKLIYKGSNIVQNSRLKNSIILRGMASNVVDEAIVILKPNIKIKKMELSKNKGIVEKKLKILKISNILLFMILIISFILN